MTASRMPSAKTDLIVHLIDQCHVASFAVPSYCERSLRATIKETGPRGVRGEAATLDICQATAGVAYAFGASGPRPRAPRHQWRLRRARCPDFRRSVSAACSSAPRIPRACSTSPFCASLSAASCGGVRHEILYPKKRPVCICNDCRVDCAEIGEWYMASPQIWQDTLHLGAENDNLCVRCLEQRLGRRIALDDLCRCPNSPGGNSVCGWRLASLVRVSPSVSRIAFAKAATRTLTAPTCKRIAEYLKSECDL